MAGKFRRALIWRFKQWRYSSFNNKKTVSIDLDQLCLEIVYPLIKSKNEAKWNNIKTAIKSFDNLIIFPGESFSFWSVLGRPSIERGYLKSRSIISGKVREETGGGLCQLSGMIFHLALLCGMKIKQRHPHSYDIYQEEERFAPLGLDATVAFPYKDLIFQNTILTPLRFHFEIDDSKLMGRIFSSALIEVRKFEIQRFEKSHFRKTVVHVFKENVRETEIKSKYKIMLKEKAV